jgi:uncharacterized membrane protein
MMESLCAGFVPITVDIFQVGEVVIGTVIKYEGHHFLASPASIMITSFDRPDWHERCYNVLMNYLIVSVNGTLLVYISQIFGGIGLT